MISEKEINLVELIRRETTKTTEGIFREKKKKIWERKREKIMNIKDIRWGKKEEA